MPPPAPVPITQTSYSWATVGLYRVADRGLKRLVTALRGAASPAVA